MHINAVGPPELPDFLSRAGGGAVPGCSACSHAISTAEALGFLASSCGDQAIGD